MTDAEKTIELYGHFLDGFIREVNPKVTKEQLVTEARVFPIVVSGTTIGIFGVNSSLQAGVKTAIVRYVYLDHKYRDKIHVTKALDSLFESFKERGFDRAEGWVLPRMAKWVERKYNIKPSLYVYNESLDYLLAEIKKRRERE